MKKIFMAFAVVALTTACNEMEVLESSSNFMVTGYNETNGDSRTAFDTPNQTTIPFLWSKGDYIWLGTSKSDAITAGCKIANFQFSNGTPAYVGTGHVFYNLTGNSEQANVLATQTADGNLGNDGDFGYATLDNYNSFCLKHKTSYLWFDTTTGDKNMPKLVSITLDADGVNIAGKQTYDYQNNVWNTTVTEGSSTITLNFAEGHTLVSKNSGVMAAMVCLPAAVSGKTLTITYTFDDGSTFTETKTPSKNFVSGATLRIITSIAKDKLVKESSYELRVLTFEDDITFEEYSFLGGDENEYNITKWSDLIVPEDEQNYAPNGNIIYANFQSCISTEYYWEDSNNTKLYHKFPENYGISNYAGGGAAVSSHTVDFSDLTKDEIYNYQVSVTCGGGNNGSSNFCVAYNASEVDYVGAGLTKNTLEFGDGEARVIDHMYVTIAAPTHYCITYGNDFSEAFDNDDYLKLVATGIKEDDTKTESLEIMLAEGADYKLTDWTKWDLSSLGKVKAIEFHMEEAQKVSYNGANGPFYYKTPLYFAFDDIAVRFE